MAAEGTPTTDTTGAPEPQRAGNLLMGPPEQRETAGPTLQDRISAAREAMGRGEDPIAHITAERGGPPPAPEQPPEEPPPAVEQPPEEPPAEAAPDDTLPEGFTRYEGGRVKGPDGKFWSAEQIAQHQQAAAEGEPPAEAEATAEEQPGEEETPPAEEAEVEGDAPEPVVVKLPGRRAGDPEAEYEVADPEFAEDINRLRNGYMRREEFHRQQSEVQASRDELDAIETSLQVDPVNFLIDHVRPEVRTDVVRHLMADEATWNAVVEDLAKWDQDPNIRRAASAELRANRLEQRGRTQDTMRQRREASSNARDIGAAIQSIVPDEMDEQAAQTFMRYAVRDLREYVNQNNIKRLDPADVPVMLHRLGTLQPFGLTPQPASQGGTNGFGRQYGGVTATRQEPAARPAARPANAGPAEGKPKAVPATKAGEQFKAARANRANAAAVAPAGVGATPARPQKPEGLSVSESIKWARKNMLRGG